MKTHPLSNLERIERLERSFLSFFSLVTGELQKVTSEEELKQAQGFLAKELQEMIDQL